MSFDIDPAGYSLSAFSAESTVPEPASTSISDVSAAYEAMPKSCMNITAAAAKINFFRTITSFRYLFI